MNLIPTLQFRVLGKPGAPSTAVLQPAWGYQTLRFTSRRPLAAFVGLVSLIAGIDTILCKSSFSVGNRLIIIAKKQGRLMCLGTRFPLFDIAIRKIR